MSRLTSGVHNQDNQCVHNCTDPDPKKRKHFEQPVIQTAQMFVGEAGCWLVIGLMALWDKYVAKKPSGQGYEAVDTADGDADDASINSATALNGAPDVPYDNGKDKGESVLRGYRITLLALPAVCDICGTTLMNVGLLLVAASIYQMTRGALVLFVGLFSVVFLHRKLHLFQWLSLVGVVVGVAIVGLAGAISPDAKDGKASGLAFNSLKTADLSEDTVRAIIGVLLIAGAQIFTASQFVLEEFILERSTIPAVRVVGWEGLFGFVVTVLGMVALHVAVGRTEAGRGGIFDMFEGWRQITADPRISISSLLIMISIGYVQPASAIPVPYGEPRRANAAAEASTSSGCLSRGA